MGELDQLDDSVELQDETQPVEQPDDTGADPFPDPVLDEEPVPSKEEPPPVPAGEPILPAAPPPSYQPPPPPVNDGGFTPVRNDTPQYQAPQPQPQPQIKFFSSQELQRGVDEGLITQAQMFDQLTFQAKEQAKQESLQAFQYQQQTASIKTQLDQFKTLVPGWEQPGSPANLRATPEFTRLLSMGMPDSDATRLLALENTFGTAQRIQEARRVQTETAQRRQTPQAVGGTGRRPATTNKKDPLDGISLDEKRVYQSYIDKGLYKDWNEVRSEVTYAAKQTVNARLRAAHQGLMR